MRNFLMFVALVIGLSCAPAFAKSSKPLADGSEPMPLCHPTPGHPCSKVYEPVVVADVLHERTLNGYTLSPDGGPLPMCPPRCVENPNAAGCPGKCKGQTFSPFSL